MAKARPPKKAAAKKPAATKPGATKPSTRSEKRHARDSRRTRLCVVGAMVLSAVILAAWFPASALYHQRANLASASAQLAQLHSQDVSLTQERHNLNDAAEVGRIARQQYQLVSPGQRAYAVLPPSGTAPANAPYAGDPGNSAPVAPSAASELPPGTVTTTTQPATTAHATTPAHAAASPAAPAQSTWARMVHALEFWR
jgi:cell division protein FtsB